MEKRGFFIASALIVILFIIAIFSFVSAVELLRFENIYFKLCADSACTDNRIAFEPSEGRMHIRAYNYEGAVLSGEIVKPNGDRSELSFGHIFSSDDYVTISFNGEGTYRGIVRAQKEGYLDFEKDFEFYVGRKSEVIDLSKYECRDVSPVSVSGEDSLTLQGFFDPSRDSVSVTNFVQNVKDGAYSPSWNSWTCPPNNLERGKVCYPNLKSESLVSYSPIVTENSACSGSVSGQYKDTANIGVFSGSGGTNNMMANLVFKLKAESDTLSCAEGCYKKVSLDIADSKVVRTGLIGSASVITFNYKIECSGFENADTWKIEGIVNENKMCLDEVQKEKLDLSANNCEDTCNPLGLSIKGSRICSGNGYKECGNFDADSCLEWGEKVACNTGEKCDLGQCYKEINVDTGCSDECSVSGQKQCSENKQQTCGNYDSDSCLEWGASTVCQNGCAYDNKQCSAPCTNDCSAVGVSRCTSSTSQEVCGYYDTDSCLEWGGRIDCASNCADTMCNLPASCNTDADCGTDIALGNNFCSDGDVYRNYVDYSCTSGVCISSTPSLKQEECGTNSCSAGKCILPPTSQTCTDQCTLGATECSGTNGLRTCGNYDSDSCSEWRISSCSSDGSTSCQTVDGRTGCFATPCTDECSVEGIKQCVEERSGYQTCGNYDSDKCLELSRFNECSSGQECLGGECKDASELCKQNDRDGDGYSTYGGVCGSVDCNDGDPNVWQTVDMCYDWDKDGYVIKSGYGRPLIPKRCVGIEPLGITPLGFPSEQIPCPANDTNLDCNDDDKNVHTGCEAIACPAACTTCPNQYYIASVTGGTAPLTEPNACGYLNVLINSLSRGDLYSYCGDRQCCWGGSGSGTSATGSATGAVYCENGYWKWREHVRGFSNTGDKWIDVTSLRAVRAGEVCPPVGIFNLGTDNLAGNQCAQKFGGKLNIKVKPVTTACTNACTLGAKMCTPNDNYHDSGYQECGYNNLDVCTHWLSKSCATGTKCYDGQCITQPPIPSELVSYWKFENNLLDSSGNLNHGACSESSAGSCPTYTSNGKLGGAYSFDSTNKDYIERASDSDFTPGTRSWTVGAWVKATGSGDRTIIEWYRCGAGPCSAYDGAIYSLIVDANNKASWWVRDDTENTEGKKITSQVLADNTWYFVVGTLNRNPTGYLLKLYVNGVLVASDSFNSVLGSSNPLSPSIGCRDGNCAPIPIEIGRRYRNPNTELPFNGIIDEARIWNRALSDSEIAEIYNNEI